MDEEGKKRIAQFRFGVIHDLIGDRKLNRGEQKRQVFLHMGDPRFRTEFYHCLDYFALGQTVREGRPQDREPLALSILPRQRITLSFKSSPH